MASKSETGPARDLAKFESLISFCTAHGTDYSPNKTSITLESLNSLLKKASTSLDNFYNAKHTLDLAINERKIAFSSIRQLSTRIINAFEVSGASDETIIDAKTINRKIQGRRASSKSTEDPQQRTISTSQQSFDNLLNNFKRLIDFLNTDAHYAPNENELKIETLKLYIQQLQKLNTAVIQANTRLSDLMIERNKIFYADKTGLIDVAKDVKKYVKSIFGTTSEQYKRISSLRFVKRK